MGGDWTKRELRACRASKQSPKCSHCSATLRGPVISGLPGMGVIFDTFKGFAIVLVSRGNLAALD